MAVFGNSKGWETFLQNLNESTLLDLLTDILSIEGHTQIKITEGPGDGKRDIHSIDEKGNKWLSQSKFHSKIEKTVSSGEIGDLPLGMIKKGYRYGIFITNAKISPQAKSEFLDDYPDLQLRFFDGLDLIKEIHENIILKAIWYNGSTIDKVNFIIKIPLVARDLDKDKPIVIPDNLIKKSCIVGRSEFEITAIKSAESTNVFNNYRSPKRKTFHEMYKTRILLADINITGNLHLEDLDEIINNAANETTEYLKTHFKQPHFALIFGESFLVPLAGEFPGTRLPLNSSSFTLVCHNDAVENEQSWLIPNKNGNWAFSKDPRPSQADWIRWYNRDCDACLNLTIISPPSEESRAKIEEDREYFINWWMKSIFFWIPAETALTWEESGIKNPTYWLNMDDGRIFGAWLHPNISQFHFRSTIECEKDEDEDQKIRMDFGEMAQEFSDLQLIINEEGGIPIFPKKARHIVGYIANDPFPITNEIEYRSVDTVINYWDIPTPISPSSRNIQFTICWIVKGIVIKNYENISELGRILSSYFHEKKIPFGISLELSKGSISKEKHYIIVNLKYKPLIGQERTQEILENLDKELSNAINEIERELNKFFLIEKATKNFWFYEIGIYF